jgi:hypothetical protein
VLFPAEHYEGLRSGAITVAFRSWKRPTVVAGGTLQSPGGLLGIDEVTVIDTSEVTDADARAAGSMSADGVLRWSVTLRSIVGSTASASIASVTILASPCAPMKTSTRQSEPGSTPG